MQRKLGIIYLVSIWNSDWASIGSCGVITLASGVLLAGSDGSWDRNGAKGQLPTLSRDRELDCT